MQGMNGLGGVLISTVNHKQQVRTNLKGDFSLLISDTTKQLYAFRAGCEEIVTSVYNFKSQHRVEIIFNMSYAMEQMIEVEKPVIYLYPEIEQDISVMLFPKGVLSYTYPKYNKQWNVVASPNGTIKTNNRTYPYLFWEANQKELTFKTDGLAFEGFYIKTDTATSFLEHKLAQVGLNNKEATDFITYWAPKMVNNDYAYVQFFIDDVYDKEIGGMTITPKPDAIRRVYMIYADSLPFDIEDDQVFIEQKLPSFKRKGFTVIEWGGSDVSASNYKVAQ